MARLKVLLVEDDEDDYVIVKALLLKSGPERYELEWARTYDEAMSALGGGNHDVCLLDYFLGARTGQELLREMKGRGFATPVIVLTGHADEGVDVDLMRSGASDYLVKGQISAPLLERSIRYAIERTQTQEQLHQARKMEAIGTLAGGIAHDFNNILASILGFAEMALEDVAGLSHVERSLRNVLKSAMRARDLVGQILAFSRKTGQARSPLALTPLLKETVKLLRASIPSTVEIVSSFAAGTDMVLAAPQEVQEMLMNLAGNAYLAMEEKGGVLEIDLRDGDIDPFSGAAGPSSSPGAYVQLTVRDTGTGMSPEVMKRIFEPFFTTREVGKGSGMGLAVVYGIATSMSGMVTVESKEGVGSVFRVFLPKEESGESSRSRAAVMPRGSERILFVDDEDMLTELNKERLRNLGYSVTGRIDSREALDLFRADPGAFDLVITDYTMPHLTGLGLTREILRIRPDIPVILSTGHSDAISSERAAEEGIAAVLLKPLEKRDLAEAVRRALDTRKGG